MTDRRSARTTETALIYIISQLAQIVVLHADPEPGTDWVAEMGGKP